MRAVSKKRQTTIRRVKPGEGVPDGEPRRYMTRDGYVLLRWRVGPWEYVEALEHRVVMGNPVGHVHHINHDQTDNRPENLQVLTASEHKALHQAETAPDAEKMERLYRAGMTTTAIAAEMGVASSCVYRTLVRNGVPVRTAGEANRMPLDCTLIRSMYEAGEPVLKIARALGVSRSPVLARLQEMGLKQ